MGWKESRKQLFHKEGAPANNDIPARAESGMSAAACALELYAHFERNHSRRTVTAKTHAQ
jgi:hypothetical protein